MILHQPLFFFCTLVYHGSRFLFLFFSPLVGTLGVDWLSVGFPTKINKHNKNSVPTSCLRLLIIRVVDMEHRGPHTPRSRTLQNVGIPASPASDFRCFFELFCLTISSLSDLSFKVKEQLFNLIFCRLIFSVPGVSVALESFELVSPSEIEWSFDVEATAGMHMAVLPCQFTRKG